jgi:hypothetical protein
LAKYLNYYGNLFVTHTFYGRKGDKEGGADVDEGINLVE